jgi:hypothetical protein
MPYLNVRTTQGTTVSDAALQRSELPRCAAQSAVGDMTHPVRPGAYLWGAFIRSGLVLRSCRVLVDEAAEPVVSADRDGLRACR